MIRHRHGPVRGAARGSLFTPKPENIKPRPTPPPWHREMTCGKLLARPRSETEARTRRPHLVPPTGVTLRTLIRTRCSRLLPFTPSLCWNAKRACKTKFCCMGSFYSDLAPYRFFSLQTSFSHGRIRHSILRLNNSDRKVGVGSAAAYHTTNKALAASNISSRPPTA